MQLESWVFIFKMFVLWAEAARRQGEPKEKSKGGDETRHKRNKEMVSLGLVVGVEEEGRQKEFASVMCGRKAL